MRYNEPIDRQTESREGKKGGGKEVTSNYLNVSDEINSYGRYKADALRSKNDIISLISISF